MLLCGISNDFSLNGDKDRERHMRQSFSVSFVKKKTPSILRHGRWFLLLPLCYRDGPPNRAEGARSLLVGQVASGILKFIASLLLLHLLDQVLNGP